MGELEKYGILSVGSVLVLFLVLSFRGGMPEEPEVSEEERHSLANGTSSEFGIVLGSSEVTSPPSPSAGNPSERRGQPARGGDVVALASTGNAGAAYQAEGGGPDPSINTGAASGPRYHVVADGETLGAISRRYLGSQTNWKEIAAVNNGLDDPRKLRVGQKLLIPASSRRPRGSSPGVAASDRATPKSVRAPSKSKRSAPKASASSHKIASGDTLSGIAKKYYSDARVWKKVFDANRDRLKRADVLPVGTIITLP